MFSRISKQITNPLTAFDRLAARAMMAFLFSFALVALGLNACSQTGANNTTKLNLLFDDYWEAQMKRYPTWATYIGDKRYDSLLTDLSPAAREKDKVTTRNFLNRLKAIDRYKLNESDRVSADMFELKLKEGVESEKFKNHTMPVNQQDGPHIDIPNLVSLMNFVSAQDYENFLSRMKAFPLYVDQTIANMREGVELGLVSAKINIEPVVEQIESFIVDDPTTSVFYQPIEKNEAELADDVLNDLAERYKETITNDIVPTYRKFGKFIRDEYLKACRDEFGVWSLPDGEERYQFLIQHHTTLPLTAREITETGLRNLELIHAEMDKIITQVGYEGTRAEFLEDLHTNPRYYYADKDSLLDGYRAILAGIKERMGEQFGILPKADCIVKELEEYRARNAPTAYYNGPAEDGSRPGTFYANTYQLDSRPIYEMEALTYHEAIPGHHLQIAIQQELEGIPMWRQHTWYTAFGEGWALYSEALPKELGFYGDPYSDFGRLIYEAWRASRLVVDCGLHYYKWDREKALQFMRDNFGGVEHNIVSEVDRYIAWPGQALGYKIGQLKIMELRRKAQSELGDKFRITEFHDQVLNTGCIPLPVLERKINDWITEKKDGSA